MITGKKFESQHEMQHPAGSHGEPGYLTCGSAALLSSTKIVALKCETVNVRAD